MPHGIEQDHVTRQKRFVAKGFLRNLILITQSDFVFDRALSHKRIMACITQQRDQDFALVGFSFKVNPTKMLSVCGGRGLRPDPPSPKGVNLLLLFVAARKVNRKVNSQKSKQACTQIENDSIRSKS